MWLKGLMNAADYYGLDELKYACNGFIQVNSISIQTCLTQIEKKCIFFIVKPSLIGF